MEIILIHWCKNIIQHIGTKYYSVYMENITTQLAFERKLNQCTFVSIDDNE